MPYFSRTLCSFSIFYEARSSGKRTGSVASNIFYVNSVAEKCM